MNFEEAKIFHQKLLDSKLFITEDCYGYVLRGTRYALVATSDYRFKFEDTCTLEIVPVEEVLNKVLETAEEEFQIRILFNLDLFVRVL